MLEAIRTVMEKEKEASKILEEAKLEAERIKREAEEKAEDVFIKTYGQIINEAKQKTLELKRKAEKARAHLQEAEVILRKAEEQATKIRTSSKEKFEEAVNVALSEIILQ